MMEPPLTIRPLLQHLEEAHEELTTIIADMKKAPGYDIGALRVSMSHPYHHLNTAWNGRQASLERHRECSTQDFGAWRRFPTDEDLLLD